MYAIPSFRFPAELIAGSLIALVLAVSLISSAQDDSSSELASLVIELLSSADKDMRALAFEQIRNEAKGAEATAQFAAQLKELPADAQVGLLSALADRADKTARPAVVDLLATSADQSVRIAAMESLIRLGEPSDWRLLAGRMDAATADERKAARAALIRLPSDEVSRRIAASMKQAVSEKRINLIEILAARRAVSAVPDLLTTAFDSRADVRAAAMGALGQLAGPKHIVKMVYAVLKAQPGAERVASEKSVMLACARIQNKQKRAQPVLTAMKNLKPAERAELLPTLGRVGGESAKKEVFAAVSDPCFHSIGIRAISNWPDASVAPELIRLATNDPHATHRTTALRALIRVAPLPDERTDQQRLALLKQAMKMSQRDSERTLVLDRARAVRIPETLRFILPYTDQPEFAEQACLTIVELAHHRDLRDAHKAEFHEALDKVIRTSKDTVVVDRAKRYKKGQTWVRPK